MDCDQTILNNIPNGNCLTVHLFPDNFKNGISKSDVIYLNRIVCNIVEKIERKLFYYAERKCIRYWELLESHSYVTNHIDKLNVIIYLRVQDMNKAKKNKSNTHQNTDKEMDPKVFDYVHVIQFHVSQKMDDNIRICFDDMSYCVLYCLENSLSMLGKKNLRMYGDMCDSYLRTKDDNFYDLLYLLDP